MKALIAVIGILSLLASPARADGAADNIPSAVRQVPPPGIEVSPEDRERLNEGLTQLKSSIEELQKRNDPQIAGYLPDVEIYHRAVDQALRFNEMFAAGDIKKADELLAEGLKRAASLAENDPYWTRQKGLVVRGFRSKLDDTVQPYGLVIPDTYRADIPYRYRTDIWFHGRGEKSVELQFIHQRMHDPGQYQPEDTIVLHPFGRYSNAFKFAGEVDVLEALDHAKANYRIDDDRISVRGFSMGGAACWQFAVHYGDRWFAANPGAGFSETPQFLQTFQGEVLQPTWWERTLWQWYDCDDWVTNLSNVPVIAYSGEIDSQKQAADVMEQASLDIGLESPDSLLSFQIRGDDGALRAPSPQESLRASRNAVKSGRRLIHIIGPDTAHRIEAGAKKKIEQGMTELATNGREDLPLAVQMVTSTLGYNRMAWVQVNGLEQHWKTGYVSARLELPNRIVVSMAGVTDFELIFGPGELPSWFTKTPTVEWDIRPMHGDNASVRSAIPDTIDEPLVNSDRSWRIRVHQLKKINDIPDRPGETFETFEWRAGAPPGNGELRKRHGLHGPVDDALTDSFIFVKPSGECRHPLVEEWTTAELDHAITHWRQQMRGDARVKADNDITEEDIANHNLILWGDPASNSVMQRIADQLPIAWGDTEITVGDRKFDAEHHAPILIYPNPLNPKKYVVLNSSFTYREYDYLNNARQTPKLPDWAIVDLRVKPDSRWPGKIVDADFFDEKWELQQPYRQRLAEQTE